MLIARNNNYNNGICKKLLFFIIVLIELQAFMSGDSKMCSATVFSLGDYFNMIALVAKSRHFWRKIFQGKDIGEWSNTVITNFHFQLVKTTTNLRIHFV